MTNEENQFFEEFCSMFENNYSNFLEEQKREFHDFIYKKMKEMEAKRLDSKPKYRQEKTAELLLGKKKKIETMEKTKDEKSKSIDDGKDKAKDKN